MLNAKSLSGTANMSHILFEKTIQQRLSWVDVTQTRSRSCTMWKLFMQPPTESCQGSKPDAQAPFLPGKVLEKHKVNGGKGWRRLRHAVRVQSAMSTSTTASTLFGRKLHHAFSTPQMVFPTLSNLKVHRDLWL